jgi:N-formylmaleamate deformylase
MSEWESGIVSANGLQLHYTRTGGEKPPLVLAHGVTDDGLCWSPLAAALAAEYDVVMVDARGHGRSQAPTDGYEPGEQADDLAGVIAALELRRPAVLGHSMGAATALVLAGRYPELPSAIVLEDPPAWWTGWYESPAAVALRADMKANALAYKSASRDELLSGARERHGGWSDAELQPWADAKLRFSPNVLTVFDAGNPARVDWPATLRRITCPALLITGDPPLGAIVTDESAALLKELVPQLDIAHVPDTGHNIRRENFDRFLEVVRGFLSEFVGRES